VSSVGAPLDPVLDRVRKLLALATSPNVHEAANAAARAQALIEEHRLEAFLRAVDVQAADPDPITDGRDAPLEIARRTRKWKLALAQAVGNANGCVAWAWERPDDVATCLVGRSRDRDAARALWEPLVVRVAWLSATAGAGRSRAWHEAFRVGAVDEIGVRLTAGVDAAREGFAALVRVSPELAAHRDALDRFVAEHLGSGRGRRLSVDARAYELGRVAGADVPLGKLRT
jgi:hypothetical protein